MYPRYLLRFAAVTTVRLTALLAAAETSAQGPEILPPCHPLIPAFQGEAFVGVTNEDVPFTSGDLRPSGECGVAPFVPVEDANGSFDLTGTPGERHLRIDAAEGSLQADEVFSNRQLNPDPATGRPRPVGSEGSCPLPTGPDDNYWTSEDCLRPGPTLHGEVDGLPDGTRLTCSPDDRAILCPANNVPYFTLNDAYLGDASDIRHRYADPANPLYQGDKFRSGLPVCLSGTPPESCVEPLYIPQFDVNNVAGIVADEDVYRPETAYSQSNAEESHPANRAFFDSLCEWSVGARLGLIYPSILRYARSEELFLLRRLSGEECTQYLEARGFLDQPGTSCQEDLSWVETLARLDANAEFSALAAYAHETGVSCFLNAFGQGSVFNLSLVGSIEIVFFGVFDDPAPAFAELWRDARGRFPAIETRSCARSSRARPSSMISPAASTRWRITGFCLMDAAVTRTIRTSAASCSTRS